MASLASLTAISIGRFFTVVRPFNMGNLTNRGVAISIGKLCIQIQIYIFELTYLTIKFHLIRLGDPTDE